MTLNEILNYNALKLRHKDFFTVVLKSDLGTFTLGSNTFHSWVCGELDLSLYTYICKCLEEEVYDIKVVNRIENRDFRLYINNEDIQFEIYEMEDREYNRRSRINEERKIASILRKV